VPESENEEGHADHSVFDLCEKLVHLQSNPLCGFEHFSWEEKVQIESESSSQRVFISTELGCKIKMVVMPSRRAINHLM
jgi:hypothetical protein